MTTTGATTPGADEQQQAALANAEALLAETADVIDPNTPPADLLACLFRYRRHLSLLATATRAVAGTSRREPGSTP